MSNIYERIEAIKDHFRYADDETKMEISGLEKSIKKAKLYSNLAEHDAVQMILEFCDKRYESISSWLENQTAEELTTQENQIKRVRMEAYREAFAWFRKLFTIQRSKEISGERKVEAIEKSME